MSILVTTAEQWYAWKVCKEKASAVQKNIAVLLQLAKEHVDKPNGYRKNLLWTDEINTEPFVLYEKN